MGLLLLTGAEIRDQYRATFDHMAKVALLQYTLGITALYLVIKGPASLAFLGLDFTRVSWAFIAAASGSALNLHIARTLRMLDRLVVLYPEQRRTLRFIATTHSWFLNPFGLWGLRVFRQPVMASLPYFAVIFGIGYAAAALFSPPLFPILLQRKFHPLMMVLMLLHLGSMLFLFHRVVRHGDLLMRNWIRPRRTNAARRPFAKSLPAQPCLRGA